MIHQAIAVGLAEELRPVDGHSWVVVPFEGQLHVDLRSHATNRQIIAIFIESDIISIIIRRKHTQHDFQYCDPELIDKINLFVASAFAARRRTTRSK